MDDHERRAERPREDTSARSDSAIQEAIAGHADLAREQRLQTEQLKAGGRTGITNEFGRLIIDGLQAISGVFRRTESQSAQSGRQAGAQESQGRSDQSDVQGNAVRPANIASALGSLIYDGIQALSGRHRPAREGMADAVSGQQANRTAAAEVERDAETTDRQRHYVEPRAVRDQQQETQSERTALRAGINEIRADVTSLPTPDQASLRQAANLVRRMFGVAQEASAALDFSPASHAAVQPAQAECIRESTRDASSDRGGVGTADGARQPILVGGKDLSDLPRAHLSIPIEPIHTVGGEPVAPSSHSDATASNKHSEKVQYRPDAPLVPVDAAALKKIQEDPHVKAAHEQLDKDIESNITNPQERARFKYDMEAFERRAAAAHPPLSANEVAETEKRIAQLLEAKDNPKSPLHHDDRVKLSEQIMHQAADPTTIDQGQHKTCSVASIEARTYTRSPAAAAKLVADIATSGEYTASDGTHVKIDPKSLKPDEEAKERRQIDGDRTHASQLFQVTAVNLAWAKTNPNYHYEQLDIKPNPHGNPPNDDSGERLVDRTDPNHPREVMDADTHEPMRRPGLEDHQLAEVSNAITGEKGNDVLIAHADNIFGPEKNLAKIDSEKALNDKLAELQRDGKLPVIMRVDARNQPFYADSGGGVAGGSGGAHFVTVTDYSPGPPPRVSVDNQWGSSVDHHGQSGLSVHDLYLSMRTPDDTGLIKDLKQDATWNYMQHKVDHAKELDLLRHQQAGDKPIWSAEEYDKTVLKIAKEAEKQWNQQKPLDQGEHDRTCKQLLTMLDTLNMGARLQVVQLLKRQGAMGNKDYDGEIAFAGKFYKTYWATARQNGTFDPLEQQAADAKLQQMLNELPSGRRHIVEREIQKKSSS